MIQERDMTYGPGTYCVVGQATPTADTPTAVQYDSLLLSVVFDGATGTIRDAECNMVLDITSEYISSLLVGRNIYSDTEAIAEDIRTNDGESHITSSVHLGVNDMMVSCCWLFLLFHCSGRIKMSFPKGAVCVIGLSKICEQIRTHYLGDSSVRPYRSSSRMRPVS